MAELCFRLLNVFTAGGNRLSGNALCVFEDGRGLDERTMQALALQFNISETTFILPSEIANARVRIFTPGFELDFAGHPTLGTAHVVRDMQGCGDALTLETKAGAIPVSAAGDDWKLQTRAPNHRPVAARLDELAAMLGLEPGEIVSPPLWIDTGVKQLIVPLASLNAVARCRPAAELLRRHGGENYLVYVWAEAGDRVQARFFFPKAGMVAEDPATGSACANLGGWFVAQGARLPLTRRVQQGEHLGRPSLLHLEVDAGQRIFVSGRVVELGRGSIET